MGCTHVYNTYHGCRVDYRGLTNYLAGRKESQKIIGPLQLPWRLCQGKEHNVHNRTHGYIMYHLLTSLRTNNVELRAFV